MDERTLSARIVIVDDQQANVALLQALLDSWGFTHVAATTDSSQAVPLCSAMDADLLLLDLHMPEPDGFAVLRALEDRIYGPEAFPVLMLTADVSTEVKRSTLALGARDFLTKPFDPEEVRLRIGNLLEMRRLQREQRFQNELLEERVNDRTLNLERARLEVLERLAIAAEYRDDDTGEHTARVAGTSGSLARAVGMPEGEARTIELAAPLHDIGKIALPDRILLKPGRLTSEEFTEMKAHAELGANMLAGSSSDLLRSAEEIASTHHERWDGTGYPCGLTGEAIPMAGRIVAVADVFDALTHRRPYKEAWPVEDAVEEIDRSGGGHFDPGIVGAFLGLEHASLVGDVAPSEERVGLPRRGLHSPGSPTT